MKLSREKCDQLVAILAVFDPAVIYLFGSFASSRVRPDSDIDIAFLPTVSVDPVDCFEASNRLADQLGRQVDLVDLTRASTVLAKEVLRTGAPIHIADTAGHQQFEMRTLADYARLNEERHAVLSQ
jgi:predicted nucleotidyltransferase